MKKIIFTIFFSLPLISFAQITYELTTPIPGLTNLNTTDLGSYVAALFNTGLTFVGLVAFGALVYNGARWVLGATNESLVSDSKKGIQAVFVGVLLLFGSVIILDTINPCILKTVNFWRNRERIQNSCGAGYFREEITREKFVRNEIKQKGTEILTTSIDGQLALRITSTTKETEQPLEVTVLADRSYQSRYISNNDWQASSSGGDITDFTWPNLSDDADTNGTISTALTDFFTPDLIIYETNDSYFNQREAAKALRVSFSINNTSTSKLIVYTNGEYYTANYSPDSHGDYSWTFSDINIDISNLDLSALPNTTDDEKKDITNNIRLFLIKYGERWATYSRVGLEPTISNGDLDLKTNYRGRQIDFFSRCQPVSTPGEPYFRCTVSGLVYTEGTSSVRPNQEIYIFISDPPTVGNPSYRALQGAMIKLADDTINANGL